MWKLLTSSSVLLGRIKPTSKDKANDLISEHEKLFLELTKDLVEESHNYWANYIREWMIDNKESEVVWVSYYRIWQVFEQKTHLNYREIQSFIKDMLLKHFKIEGKTPG